MHGERIARQQYPAVIFFTANEQRSNAHQDICGNVGFWPGVNGVRRCTGYNLRPSRTHQQASLCDEPAVGSQYSQTDRRDLRCGDSSASAHRHAQPSISCRSAEGVCQRPAPGRPESGRRNTAASDRQRHFGVGVCDTASPLGLADHDNDFGKTLTVWGWGDASYLMVPLIGPSNPRNALGFVGDIVLDLAIWLQYKQLRVVAGRTRSPRNSRLSCKQLGGAGRHRAHVSGLLCRDTQSTPSAPGDGNQQNEGAVNLHPTACQLLE
jgi:hypothetical protein